MVRSFERRKMLQATRNPHNSFEEAQPTAAAENHRLLPPAGLRPGDGGFWCSGLRIQECRDRDLRCRVERCRLEHKVESESGGHTILCGGSNGICIYIYM